MKWDAKSAFEREFSDMETSFTVFYFGYSNYADLSYNLMSFEDLFEIRWLNSTYVLTFEWPGQVKSYISVYP